MTRRWLTVAGVLIPWVPWGGCRDTRPAAEGGREPTAALQASAPLAEPACDLSGFDAAWQSHFVAGNVLRRPEAKYPPEAAARGISGMVAVDVVVDREGRVSAACATTGPGELRRAAEQAALGWRFKPHFGRTAGDTSWRHVRAQLTFVFRPTASPAPALGP